MCAYLISQYLLSRMTSKGFVKLNVNVEKLNQFTCHTWNNYNKKKKKGKGSRHPYHQVRENAGMPTSTGPENLS